MPSPEEQFQLLIAMLHGLQIRKLLMSSAVILLAYDLFLTFDREYKYIWKAKWSLSKFIYLLFRYFVLAWQLGLFGKYLFGVDTDISPKYCQVMHAVDTVQAALVHQLAILAMTIRTSVLYQNQRSINLLLAIGYLLNCAGTLSLVISVTTHVKAQRGALGLDIGCVYSCEGCELTSRINWVPVEAFGIVLCILTIRRAIQQGQIFSTRLTTVLYRDGFAYFGIVFFSGSLQLLLISTFYDNYYLTLIFWALVQANFRAVISITCCRMILNLQGVLTKPSEFDMSIYPTGEQPNTSAMRFDSGPKTTADSADVASTYCQTASGRDILAQSSAGEVELGRLSRQTPSQAQGW